MINQPLLDYIKQQHQQGASEEQIRNSLVSNGWQQSDVTEALATFHSNKTPVPQPPTSAIPQPIVASGKSKIYIVVSWLYLVSGIAILIKSLTWLLPLYGSSDFNTIFSILQAILIFNIAPITLILSGLALYALAGSQKKATTVIGLSISIVIFVVSIFSLTPSALSNSLILYIYNFVGIFSAISIVCFFFSLRKNKNKVLAWVILGIALAYIIIPLSTSILSAIEPTQPISMPPLPY